MARFPMTVSVDTIAAMLNLELADHPVYDGLELQWFDDGDHGTGLLAFLSRRAGGTVDYYVQPGLRLDRDSYAIGGGTGAWVETDFEAARLVVADDGVDAEVRFVDVDGRAVEVRVDDRDGRRRGRAGLLAPVGDGIVDPTALLLVWLPRFDLVRRGDRAPTVRIDGAPAAIGRLPGARLHRRHLIKYAAPLVVVEVLGDRTGSAGEPGAAAGPEPTAGDGGDVGPAAGGTSGARSVGAGAGSTAGGGDAGQAAGDAGPTAGDVDGGDPTAGGEAGVVVARRGEHVARLDLDPPPPDLADLPDGETGGRWEVAVDGVVLTGGRWWARRSGNRVDLGVDVTERWRPHRPTRLVRVVTAVVPVFRRWPTTYRWRGSATLGFGRGVTGRWERTGSGGGDEYRRATGS